MKPYHKFKVASYPSPPNESKAIKELYERLDAELSDFSIVNRKRYAHEEIPNRPTDLIVIWANRFLLELCSFKIFKIGFDAGFKFGCEIAETVSDVRFKDPYLTEVFKHVKYTFVDFVAHLSVPPPPLPPPPKRARSSTQTGGGLGGGLGGGGGSGGSGSGSDLGGDSGGDSGSGLGIGSGSGSVGDSVGGSEGGLGSGLGSDLRTESQGSLRSDFGDTVISDGDSDADDPTSLTANEIHEIIRDPFFYVNMVTRMIELMYKDDIPNITSDIRHLTDNSYDKLRNTFVVDFNTSLVSAINSIPDEYKKYETPEKMEDTSNLLIQSLQTERETIVESMKTKNSNLKKLIWLGMLAASVARLLIIVRSKDTEEDELDVP